MIFHLCNSYGCYLNLAAITYALATTISIIFILKVLLKTNLESWNVTPNNEEEDYMMQNDKEGSVFVPLLCSTIDPSLGRTCSLGQGSILGEETLEDPDKNLQNGWATPECPEQLRAWTVLDQPSMHCSPSLTTASRTSAATFSMNKEPHTNSSPLSFFKFESRQATPPPPTQDEFLAENTSLGEERKRQKASCKIYRDS